MDRVMLYFRFLMAVGNAGTLTANPGPGTWTGPYLRTSIRHTAKVKSIAAGDLFGFDGWS